MASLAYGEFAGDGGGELLAEGVALVAFAEEIPCFEDIHCIPFSAKTGEGRDALVDVLEELAEDDEDDEDADDEDDTAPSDPAED